MVELMEEIIFIMIHREKFPLDKHITFQAVGNLPAPIHAQILEKDSNTKHVKGTVETRDIQGSVALEDFP